MGGHLERSFSNGEISRALRKRAGSKASLVFAEINFYYGKVSGLSCISFCQVKELYARLFKRR